MTSAARFARLPSASFPRVHGPAKALVDAAGRARRDFVQAARLGRDLPGFLQSPVTVEKATWIVRRRLERRPERLVEMVERAIYAHPESPHLRLLRVAGCELGDFRALVSKEGVEGALTHLAGAGVYLTFDEFKGLKEVVRGSQRFAFSEEQLDNPRASFHFELGTGGSRGRATSVKVGLDWIGDCAIGGCLALHAPGLSEAEHVVWMSGPHMPLMYAKLGRPPSIWLSPLKPTLETLVGSWYLAFVSRFARSPVPPLGFLDLQHADRMAAWLAARLRRGRNVCLSTRPSSAVRVAAAANDVGTRLHGLCFYVGGEPCTDAHKRTMEDCGARVLVRYATMEAGLIAYSCPNGQAVDDLHFSSDSYAVVQRSRPVEQSDVSVEAFLFTSLLPSAPKILLNVENGDYGQLDRRQCGCQLAALGLEDHISQIRSFEKLTGEGMTFIKTNLVRVLEEVLPERFGGSSADYQVVEEAGEGGILRLYLLVSPSIGRVEEEQIKQTFLSELGRDGEIESYMARMWERAGTVQIRRETPMATRGGKVFPFHLVKDPIS